MIDPVVESTLRRLYQAEFRCPTARWKEATPFVSWADAQDDFALQQIAAEDREHLAWLAELLVERGSAPPPASYATDTAGTHYSRLDALLPMLVTAERKLIQTYQTQSAGLAADPDAARRVAQIVQRHSNHLAKFESLQAGAKA